MFGVRSSALYILCIVPINRISENKCRKKASGGPNRKKWSRPKDREIIFRRERNW